MDWITSFPKAADGSDAVLVFIDVLTGMEHFPACQKTDTSKDTAQHFVHNVVKSHGVPRGIHSDCNIRLMAHFWKSLCITGATWHLVTIHNSNVFEFYTTHSDGRYRPRYGAGHLCCSF